MKTIRFACVAALAFVVSAGGPPAAFGQGVVTQWTFNGASPTLTPNIGSGTAATVGGTTPAFAGGLTNGGSTDRTSTSNMEWSATTFPDLGAGSGTRGVQFAIDTSSASNLVFRFDQRYSNTSNRFVSVEYTTNGTDWTPAAVFAATLGSGDTRYNNRTVDLSSVAGSPNFAVRLVSIFDPNGTDYVAANAGSNYAPGGTWRFDAVTLTSGHVWTGGGANTSLGTAGNFAGAAAPGTNATVLLGTAAGANTSITTAAGGTTVDQVLFQAGAPAFTISGGDTLTINAGIVNNSINRQTIAAPVNFAAANRIQSSNGAALALNSSVAFTNILLLDGNGATTLNGAVQGAFAANPSTTGNPSRPTIRVADGNMLAGVGTIGTTGSTNNVEVFGGGIIRGGDGGGAAAERVGTLTINGNVALASTAAANGVLRVEASRNTSTTQVGNLNADSSVLSATGFFNLNPGAGNTFAIDIVNGSNPLVIGEAYTLQLIAVTSAASLQLNGTAIGANATIDPSNYIVTSSDLVVSNISLTTNATGTGLYLTFTPVPEPGTVLGLSAAVLGIGGWVRRRRSLALAA